MWSLYVDKGSSFGRNELWAFNGLLDCSHKSIHKEWVANLNLSQEAQLAFVRGGEQF
jgi:hypothetical protein